SGEENRGGKPCPLRPREKARVAKSVGRAAGIFVVACVCGIASGMFGIGGGVLLVPLLVFLYGFIQHRAQGTSLVALIALTGVLALIAYAKGGFVSWKAGLLLIPGVFLGGIVGGRLAEKLQPQRMRQVFTGILFVLGAWQAFSAWWRGRRTGMVDLHCHLLP